MDIKIRRIKPEDYEAVHNIFSCKGVIQGTMRLPYEALEHTSKRLEPSDGKIQLVATVNDETVGFAELITFPTVARHRHVGEVNMITVRDDMQGKGIGRKLMQALLDLSDQWLQLTRLGLIVIDGNEPAIHLYQSLGFKMEGTMPAYVFRAGEYIAGHMMRRLLHQ